MNQMTESVSKATTKMTSKTTANTAWPGHLLNRHLLTKLFVSFLAMAALTVGLLWLIQAGLMRDMYLNQRIDHVRSAIDVAAADAISGAAKIDVETLSAEIDASIVVFDENGQIVAASSRMSMMGLASRHMQTMIAAADFSVCEIFTTNDQSNRYALIGQHLNGQGHVFALFSLGDVDAAAQILRDQLSLITIVLALAAILIAFFLSHRLSKPILAATRAARQLAAGELDVRLAVQGQDEIAQLSHALNELSVQLHATENLRRELIANVSHELRSPLTMIQGYAETVRDVTWPDEQKRHDQLTLISDEAARLTQVVGDILDFSKLQAGVKPPEMTEFSTDQALESLSHRFALAAAARKQTIDIACAVEAIRFDPRQFDQVVTNLLANAINHADSNSQIQIKAESIDQGRRAKISVINTGDTIPASELPNLWERFYRSTQVQDEQRLGSGLGLAIVRSILLQHHVQFGVESLHRTTTFWFETATRVDV
ncbi:MAG: HAMP domain-containing sensor histidine kinase [Eubacteriales bacterium]|nr:HAMP domain-containing sensor histidine kinase [Eubacteriales bacterium]